MIITFMPVDTQCDYCKSMIRAGQKIWFVITTRQFICYACSKEGGIK